MIGPEAAQRLRAHGKMGDPEHFRRALNKVCEELGLDRLFPGAYRHTFLTQVENEHDRATAQEQAFHASPKITAIYTAWSVGWSRPRSRR